MKKVVDVVVLVVGGVGVVLVVVIKGLVVVVGGVMVENLTGLVLFLSGFVSS